MASAMHNHQFTLWPRLGKFPRRDEWTAKVKAGSVPGLVENAGRLPAREHAHYSMISSARASTDGGIVSPRAFRREAGESVGRS
jgi:hypothetical protein